MVRDNDKDFENSSKYQFCDNVYVKAHDDCHIAEKYRGSEHRNCNINVKPNRKIPVIFHNLKHYDSHPFMQKLGKFNLKINVKPNGLKKTLI